MPRRPVPPAAAASILAGLREINKLVFLIILANLIFNVSCRSFIKGSSRAPPRLANTTLQLCLHRSCRPAAPPDAHLQRRQVVAVTVSLQNNNATKGAIRMLPSLSLVATPTSTPRLPARHTSLSSAPPPGLAVYPQRFKVQLSEDWLH